jgi:hypothetical protein
MSFSKSDAPDASGEKVKCFKEESGHIIQKYFLSDDVPELIRSLQELSAPEYNTIFLKKLIMVAMDRKNREKEMASVLLSSLSLELFSTEDIMKGFIMLLWSAEDTALDIVSILAHKYFTHNDLIVLRKLLILVEIICMTNYKMQYTVLLVEMLTKLYA